MEMGPQERRERIGARPSETPTSEISGRPVVMARPSVISNDRADSGRFGNCYPLYTCVIQQGWELTIWWFVRDRWNRRCGNSCPNGGCVAVRELDEFEVEMEVDESEMRSTPGKKIWSKWVETRKDPNS